MNAVPILLRCYEHQHPDEFGRAHVSAEYPRESATGYDAEPPGCNREGFVPEAPRE